MPQRSLDNLYKGFRIAVDPITIGSIQRSAMYGFSAERPVTTIEYSVLEIPAAFAEALHEEVRVEIDPAKVRKTDRLHLPADITKLREFTCREPLVGIDEGIGTLKHTDRSRLTASPPLRIHLRNASLRDSSECQRLKSQPRRA